MNSSKIYDILVIGVGPIGSPLASQLANEGFKILNRGFNWLLSRGKFYLKYFKDADDDIGEIRLLKNIKWSKIKAYILKEVNKAKELL